MSTETKVVNLVLNVLTEDEYAAAAKNENELYLVKDDADIEAMLKKVKATLAAVESTLAGHVADVNNPHGVTAKQTGAATSNPFEEKFVEIIPVDFENLTEYPDVEDGHPYVWIELPEPIYLDKYKYKLTLSVWGLQKQGKESGATPTCMEVVLIPNADNDDDISLEFNGISCTEEPTDVDVLSFPRLCEYTVVTSYNDGHYREFQYRCGYASGEKLPVMSDQRLAQETAYDPAKPLKYARLYIYDSETAVTETTVQTFGVALSYRAIAEV